MIVKAGNDERFRLYLQQMTGIRTCVFTYYITCVSLIFRLHIYITHLVFVLCSNF